MPDQLFFDIVKMVLALASIVGLVFAVVWLMKRFLPGAARAAAERVDMYMVGQLAVGNRQRVAVVRVHDRVLVLGITEGSITTLADLTPPRTPAAAAREAAKEAAKEADDPKIFSDLLAWPKDGGPKASGQPGQQPAQQPSQQSAQQPGPSGPGVAAAAELAGKNLGAVDKDAIRDLFDSLSGPPK